MKLQEPMRNLCAPLMAVILLLVLGGEADVPVHRPALLHGSVRISYSPSQKKGTIRLITWRFDKNGNRSTILDTTEKPYYIYPSQFRERLVMSEDLYTMTIKDLTLEDGGIYTVDIADRNGRKDFSSFNVTVYEPTPRPTITPHMIARTSGGCNVSLNCSAPSQTSDLSYSWKYRHQDSTYQPYGNGRSIQISLPQDHQDMELLCIVQNPADQKNVSIRFQDACASTAVSPRGRSLHLLVIKPVQCALFTLPLILYIAIMVTGRKGSQVSLKNPNVVSHEVTTC